MTQEERNLLVKELSSRLPYLTYVEWNDGYALLTPDRLVAIISNNFGNDWKRPFLRPMSSMTEDEIQEYKTLFRWIEVDGWGGETVLDFVVKMEDYRYLGDILNWLNAHHFDYRGLIPMGLALEAPEGMYNENR